MNKNTENTGLNLSVKSFISAIVVIFLLMVATYGLTFIIPGGGIPFWKYVDSGNDIKTNGGYAGDFKERYRLGRLL